MDFSCARDIDSFIDMVCCSLSVFLGESVLGTGDSLHRD